MNADGTMSEDAFQGLVMAHLEMYGWTTYHTLDSRGSTPGFPDIVAVRKVPPRLLFIELKTARGRLRPEQEVWLNLIQAISDVTPNGTPPVVEQMVLRPPDWDEFERHTKYPLRVWTENE